MRLNAAVERSETLPRAVEIYVLSGEFAARCRLLRVENTSLARTRSRVASGGTSSPNAYWRAVLTASSITQNAATAGRRATSLHRPGARMTITTATLASIAA